MDVREHIRLPIPIDQEIEQIRKWCKKWLNSPIKIKYHRIRDPKTNKWMRDYDRRPMVRFFNDDDAVAYKIRWTT